MCVCGGGDEGFEGIVLHFKGTPTAQTVVTLKGFLGCI